jgi:hypothetical protein
MVFGIGAAHQWESLTLLILIQVGAGGRIRTTSAIVWLDIPQGTVSKNVSKRVKLSNSEEGES